MPSDRDLVDIAVVGLVVLCAGLLPWGLFPAARALLRKRGQWREQRVERLAEDGHTDQALALLKREADRLGRKGADAGSSLKLVDNLRHQAGLTLQAGRVDEAIRAAAEAIQVIDNLASPAPLHAAATYMTLGQALARRGDDDEALTQLRKSVSFSVAGQDTETADGTSVRASALVNTSMVLRRLGHADEALELATQAARIQEDIHSHAEPYMLAGAGWAYAALALAQTDLAQDGRRAANDSLRVFRLLEQDGVFARGESEGYAFACYTKAYALHRFGDGDAEKFAREAVDRFAQLHAVTPSLYQRRLHDAEQLLAMVATG